MWYCCHPAATCRPPDCHFRPAKLAPPRCPRHPQRCATLLRQRAIGSAGERFVHTEEVTGSIPVSPTTRAARQTFTERSPLAARTAFRGLRGFEPLRPPWAPPGRPPRSLVPPASPPAGSAGLPAASCQSGLARLLTEPVSAIAQNSLLHQPRSGGSIQGKSLDDRLKKCHISASESSGVGDCHGI